MGSLRGCVTKSRKPCAATELTGGSERDFYKVGGRSDTYEKYQIATGLLLWYESLW